MKNTHITLSIKKPSLWLFCFIAFAGGLYTQSCRRQENTTFTRIQYHPEHIQYVSAFPNGELAKNGNIIIRFARNMAKPEMVSHNPYSSRGVILEESREIVDISPGIKGKWLWIDTRTLILKPDAWLQSGLIYDGKIDLKVLIDTVPDYLRYFPIKFSVRPATINFTSASLGPMGYNSGALQQIRGEIRTGNPEHAADVEACLAAIYGTNKLHTEWVHYSDSMQHVFRIDSIERPVINSTIELKLNGQFIGSALHTQRSLNIAGKGDFVLNGAQTFSTDEQYIELQFSDRLDPVQNLAGLIHSPQTKFTFRIDNGVIKAFPKEKLLGPVQVTIEKGIKNAMGYSFNKQQTEELTFNDINPQLRMLGDGTIIPHSHGNVPFPFEAINLKAVDVRITRIYEKNIQQFLQFNSLSGTDYLDYVGKVVAEKKIVLDNGKKADLTHWGRYALNLAELVKTEPGAIYNVDIRFRKDYSLYACQAPAVAANEDAAEEEEEGDGEEEMENMEEVTVDTHPVVAPGKEKADPYMLDKKQEKLWDYYNTYTYYYNNNYQNSPCNDQYYKRMYGIRRNVLASDMGIMAKKGTDGSMMIAVSDLATAQPRAGVRIELYSFQQQRLRYGYTGPDGMANFSAMEMPFLAIATSGNEKGYLKFRDASLSMSNFDVQGTERHKGIEGYIYTERGVWRPGDSIYVNFLLEDRDKKLPATHPVIFELYNPSGQLVQREVKKNDVNGFFSFPTATGLDAPTGNYSVKINVGGIFFHRSLKVETIKPNRLKMELKIPDDAVTAGETNIGELQVNWLHGAAASRLKAEVNVTVNGLEDAFPAYKEYSFHDPLKQASSDNAVIYEGSLDEKGHATIPNNINITASAPGPLKANFYTKAVEESGDFSTDFFRATYFPFDQYVGVKPPKGDGDVGVLFTDKEHTLQFVTVDKGGKAVNSKVDVMLYRLEWRWWWDYYRDLSSYNGRMYNDPLSFTTIQTKNGKGEWKVKIPENEYGRYLIRAVDEKGHSTGKVVYFDHPGWYNRREQASKGTTMLNFSTTKPVYKVGEMATIEIPKAYNGRALVTIENAQKVVHAEWINAREKNTTYSFKVTKDMAPNVYACVTLLQPHAQTLNDLPIRLYGVAPIMVDNPASHLDPVLNMPAVIEPEQNLKLQVSEAQGKKMTYTIAIVDEGLLDLTHFRTPAPWQHFNAKEALKVRSWDIFDEVMGDYTSNLKKLMSVGGDGYEDDAPGKGTKVQRFKPMVRFLGPFTLQAGKTATHSVKMPQYIGSVRTMLIAGYDGAYGAVEKTTPVKKPLMAFGTLPRVLGPQEEVMLPVTIFAMEDNIKDVTVSIKSSDILYHKGAATQDVRFDAKGEKMLYFPMKVKNEIGIASVEITAVCGNEKAKFNIELEVRPPNPYSSRTSNAMVEANKSLKLDFTAFGIKGSNSGMAEISIMPPLNMEKRLNYLIQYPHGCIEQTTSSVFPQLYVQDLMKLPDARKKAVEANIKAGIKRLYLFQLSSGGMSYWPGGRYNDASEWGTNYAGHFLIAAKQKGYNVPAQMIENLVRYQAEQAKNWNFEAVNKEFAHYYNSNDLIQAYRLYILALAGKPEMGAMNRMRSLSDNLSNKSLWRLAAAYYLSGQKDIALNLVKEAGIDVDKYTELGNTYGSDGRDRAMILEAMVNMGESIKAYQLVLNISDHLKSDHWMSTQETAYSLMAMSEYAALSGKKGMYLEYRINEGEWQKIHADKSIFQADLHLEKHVSGHIEIKNSMDVPMNVNIIATGIAEAGNEVADQKQLAMEVHYFSLKGDTLDPVNLAQGTDFYAEITVENQSNRDRLDEMALTAIFPSGWQIHNPRMEGSFIKATSNAEYMDVRDDRVYLYYDLIRPNGRYYRRYSQDVVENKKTFRIALNASFEGKYYMPGIYTEAMYDKDIHAHATGKWVTVTKNRLQ